jgi:RHS repeat-associated protein
MVMPGRTYSANSEYRYGFNGKENDKEIYGESNAYDFGARIHDPRLGRFLSTDPLESKYTDQSTYVYAANSPIQFIDVDGMGPGSPARRSGTRGRVTGLRSYAEELARQVNERIRENQREREREEELKEIFKIINDPAYARQVRANTGFFSRISRIRYLQNVANTGQSVFGAGIAANRLSGDRFDNLVHATMLSNPNYIGVARQISLKVTGTINGQTVVANIRVDNVGVSSNGNGGVLFNLVEAKYSIYDITINNVRQTLTKDQRIASDIFINGTDVSIAIRGVGSAVRLSKASNGSLFIDKQVITGNVSQINIVAPAPNNTGQSTNNSSTSNTTNPPPVPPVTNSNQ